MRVGFVAVAGLALALVLASGASAAVRKTSFTAKVAAGDSASLTVAVAPRARCTIKVVYSTGPSRAAGLHAKSGGKIAWTWRVGSNTKPGLWPVTVDCGRSGKLSLRLRVVPG
jgi:hypothetical protein